MLYKKLVFGKADQAAAQLIDAEHCICMTAPASGCLDSSHSSRKLKENVKEKPVFSVDCHRANPPKLV